MRRVMAVVTGSLFVMAAANAAPSSNVAFDAETRALLASGDPGNGKALAKERKCAKCHGDVGVSDEPGDANIAGLRASYIYKQLRDYKDGKREDRDMKKATRDLDDREMADLAAWFASLPPAMPGGGRVEKSIGRLVYRGDPSRMIKACSACHGRDGRGGQYDYAAIAGQNRDYFVDTISAFKDGSRVNDVYSRMRLIAEALTADEIKGLAEYYAPTAVPKDKVARR